MNDMPTNPPPTGAGDETPPKVPNGYEAGILEFNSKVSSWFVKFVMYMVAVLFLLVIALVFLEVFHFSQKGEDILSNSARSTVTAIKTLFVTSFSLIVKGAVDRYLSRKK
ncbi:MAG: hypothetical protein LBN04_00285 [Oscillospiraceae bacterium]|jgi:di/tricarboxylate transporter|nr:hypothetical protein [Oscillospiraceae bacterium]